MPKIRRRKRNTQSEPSSYLSGRERNWMDDERERNGAKVRRYFIAALVVVAILLVVLIFSVISAGIQQSDQAQRISASDTFAVTQVEQDKMASDAENFAGALLLYFYSSDDAVAEQARAAALAYVPRDSEVYDQVSSLNARYPSISPDAFAPILTEPSLKDPTRAYATSFTYDFSGTGADMSKTSSDGTQGVLVGRGWNFRIGFENLYDENSGEHVWVITSAKVSPK